MMKIKITLTVLLLTFANSAFAFTYFMQGKHPSELLNKGNAYKSGNPYRPNNPLNPYHTLRNPYNNKSVYHNHDLYSAQITDQNGKLQGQISQQVNNPKAITNPYGQYGNPYSPTHVNQPYSKNNPNNPYSQFQSIYNPKSVRHNGQYGVQYKDSQGNYLGHSKSDSYKTNSIFNPYHNQHNPYYYQNTQNPYDTNKNK